MEDASKNIHNPSIAYKDEAFIDTDDARPLRILAEYLAPLRAFRRAGVHDTVVFFGSARLSQNGPLGRYYEEARYLSRLITEWACTMPADRHRLVVCSGGGGGIMEAANRGAMEAGAAPSASISACPTSNGPMGLSHLD